MEFNKKQATYLYNQDYNVLLSGIFYWTLT